MKIPQSLSDYVWAVQDRFIRPPFEQFIVDDKIMPLRQDGEPAAGQNGVNFKRCLRGVDPFFLTEAIITRTELTGESQTCSGTVSIDIQAERLNKINNDIGLIWNNWGITQQIGNFSGIHYHEEQGDPYDPSEMAERIKQNVGFQNALGTRLGASINFSHELRQNDMLTLFKDMKNKQCCFVPAPFSWKVDGVSSENMLENHSENHINKIGLHEVNHHVASNVVLKLEDVYKARSLKGARVKLFAYGGYYMMKARDYPTYDLSDYGSCIIPTDNQWHTIDDVGSTITLSASQLVSNIISVANPSEPRPEVPEDQDPESTKSRQCAWRYYFALNAHFHNAFVALVDLEHTNLVDTDI